MNTHEPNDYKKKASRKNKSRLEVLNTLSVNQYQSGKMRFCQLYRWYYFVHFFSLFIQISVASAMFSRLFFCFGTLSHTIRVVHKYES